MVTLMTMTDFIVDRIEKEKKRQKGKRKKFPWSARQLHPHTSAANALLRLCFCNCSSELLSV